MGWSGMYRIPEDRAAFCRGELGAGYEVLSDSMVGSTWYAAVRRKDTGHVFAAVFLTKISRYKGEREFMWKTMDEGVGPCERDCPKKILDLLSPLDDSNDAHGYARAWRQDCHDKRAKKRAAAAPDGKLAHGAVVYSPRPLEFGDGVTASRFVSREKSKPWREKSQTVLRFIRPDGSRCRIHRSTIPLLMTEAEYAEFQKEQPANVGNHVASF